jgi:hypothetical protein
MRQVSLGLERLRWAMPRPLPEVSERRLGVVRQLQPPLAQLLLEVAAQAPLASLPLPGLQQASQVQGLVAQHEQLAQKRARAAELEQRERVRQKPEEPGPAWEAAQLRPQVLTAQPLPRLPSRSSRTIFGLRQPVPAPPAYENVPVLLLRRQHRWNSNGSSSR